MEDQSTIALVLRVQPYSETSQLVRVLGPEGVVNVLARGVARKNSRFGGPFEVHEIVDFTYRIKRSKKDQSLHELISGRHREWFPGLRENLQAFHGAELVREVLMAIPLPQAEATECLRLALLALRALDQGKSALAVGARFLSTLLVNFGLTPELYQCVRSGRNASGKASVMFSLREFGLLSPPEVKQVLAEGHPERDLIKLTPTLLELLRGLFDRNAKLSASKRGTWNDAFLFCECLFQLASGRALATTPALLDECGVARSNYRALMLS